MIYNNFVHKIFRGHWFTPHIVGVDRYQFDQHQGCEICLLTNVNTFLKDLHNEGICSKAMLGYNCHGATINGVPYAECGQ